MNRKLPKVSHPLPSTGQIDNVLRLFAKVIEDTKMSHNEIERLLAQKQAFEQEIRTLLMRYSTLER